MLRVRPTHVSLMTLRQLCPPPKPKRVEMIAKCIGHIKRGGHFFLIAPVRGFSLERGALNRAFDSAGAPVIATHRSPKILFIHSRKGTQEVTMAARTEAFQRHAPLYR